MMSLGHGIHLSRAHSRLWQLADYINSTTSPAKAESRLTYSTEYLQLSPKTPLFTDMRSSLSCDACRRAKVKCAHSGTPPCQRCTKSKINGCILTRPQLPPPRKRKSQSVSGVSAAARRELSRGSASMSRTASEQLQIHPQLQAGTETGSPLLVPGPAQPGDSVTALVGRHIASLPNSVILKTLSAFTNKFPELAILHVPTFMAELESRALSRESMGLLGAVLAVTRGQLTVLGASWASALLSREEYAVYTREMLSQFILQPPKLQVVQMLLIITLYEWGTRNFHKAWVYCGESCLR